MQNSGFANPADKLVLIVDDDESVRELLSDKQVGFILKLVKKFPL